MPYGNLSPRNIIRKRSTITPTNLILFMVLFSFLLLLFPSFAPCPHHHHLTLRAAPAPRGTNSLFPFCSTLSSPGFLFLFLLNQSTHKPGFLFPFWPCLHPHLHPLGFSLTSLEPCFQSFQPPFHAHQYSGCPLSLFWSSCFHPGTPLLSLSLCHQGLS